MLWELCQKLLSWSPGQWNHHFSHLLRILNSTIPWSLQPRLPLTFKALTSSTLFKRSGPGRSWSPTSSSNTWVWKLAPMYSRSLLNYFCPALMSLQQFLGWLRSPVRTSASLGEASSSSLHRDTQHSLCPLNPTQQLPAVSSPLYVYILLSEHIALLPALFSVWY